MLEFAIFTERWKDGKMVKWEYEDNGGAPR